MLLITGRIGHKRTTQHQQFRNLTVELFDKSNRFISKFGAITIRTNHQEVKVNNRGFFMISLDPSILRSYYPKTSEVILSLQVLDERINKKTRKKEQRPIMAVDLSINFDELDQYSYIADSVKLFERGLQFSDAHTINWDTVETLIDKINALVLVKEMSWDVVAELQTGFDLVFPVDTNNRSVVLLPLRMELRRFSTGESNIFVDYERSNPENKKVETFHQTFVQDEYWIRWFPNEVHFKSIIGKIKDEEVEFWTQYGSDILASIASDFADIETDIDQQTLWKKLAKKMTPVRARQILKNIDLNGSLLQEGLWDFDTETEETEPLAILNTQGVQIETIPDEIYLILLTNGQLETIQTIYPNTDPLALMPEDLTSDTWVSNFDQAIELGLGIKINDQDTVNKIDAADWLFVCGIKANSHGMLDKILQSKNAAGALSVLTQDTPTNNTEYGTTGFSRRIDDDITGYIRETQHQVSTESIDNDYLRNIQNRRTDTHLFTELFNFKPTTLGEIRNGGITEQIEASAMASIVFDSIRFITENIWEKPLPALSDHLDDLRDFFIKYVKARGTFPILRIGEDPYGILPVVAIEDWHAGKAKDIHAKYYAQPQVTTFPSWMKVEDEPEILENVVQIAKFFKNYMIQLLPSIPTLTTDPGDNPMVRFQRLLDILRTNRVSKYLDARPFDFDMKTGRITYAEDPQYIAGDLVRDFEEYDIDYTAFPDINPQTAYLHRIAELDGGLLSNPLQLDEYTWGYPLGDHIFDNYEGLYIELDEATRIQLVEAVEIMSIVLMRNVASAILQNLRNRASFLVLNGEKRSITEKNFLDIIRDLDIDDLVNILSQPYPPLEKLPDGGGLYEDAILLDCGDDNLVYLIDYASKNDRSKVRKPIHRSVLEDYYFDPEKIRRCPTIFPFIDEIVRMVEEWRWFDDRFSWIFDHRMIDKDIIFPDHPLLLPTEEAMVEDLGFVDSMAISARTRSMEEKIRTRIKKLQPRSLLLRSKESGEVYLIDETSPQFKSSKSVDVVIDETPKKIRGLARKASSLEALEFHNFDTSKIKEVDGLEDVVAKLPRGKDIDYNFNGAMVELEDKLYLIDQNKKRHVPAEVKDELFVKDLRVLSPDHGLTEHQWNWIQNLEEGRPLSMENEIYKINLQEYAMVDIVDNVPVLRNFDERALAQFQFELIKVRVCGCSYELGRNICGRHKKFEVVSHEGSTEIYFFDNGNRRQLSNWSDYTYNEKPIFKDEVQEQEESTRSEQLLGCYEKRDDFYSQAHLIQTVNDDVYFMLDEVDGTKVIRYVDQAVVDKYFNLPGVELREPSPVLKRVLFHLLNHLLTREVVDNPLRYTSLMESLIAACDLLQYVTPDRLEILLMEVFDLFSHRMDAWITGVAHERFVESQKYYSSSPEIGVYGWLEKPGEFRPVPQAEPQYIQAPSTMQASAGAVIRNASIFETEDPSTLPFQLNLSSEQAKKGLDFLDGLRKGHLTEELIGYKIERFIHDRILLDGSDQGFEEVDIYKLREEFPLAIQAASETINAADGEEAIYVPTVIHGTDFLAADIENVVRTKLADNDDKVAAYLTLRDEISQIPDAAADIVLMETIYQFIQGNTTRMGAWLQYMDGEVLPPEIEYLSSQHIGDQQASTVYMMLNPPVGRLELDINAVLASADIVYPRRILSPLLFEYCQTLFAGYDGTQLSVHITNLSTDPAKDHDITVAIEDLGSYLDFVYDGQKAVVSKIQDLVIESWFISDLSFSASDPARLVYVNALGAFPHHLESEKLRNVVQVEITNIDAPQIKQMFHRFSLLRSVLSRASQQNAVINLPPKLGHPFILPTNFDDFDVVLAPSLLLYRLGSIMRRLPLLKSRLNALLTRLDPSDPYFLAKRFLHLMHRLKSNLGSFYTSKDAISLYRTKQGCDRITSLITSHPTFLTEFSATLAEVRQAHQFFSDLIDAGDSTGGNTTLRELHALIATKDMNNAADVAEVNSIKTVIEAILDTFFAKIYPMFEQVHNDIKNLTAEVRRFGYFGNLNLTYLDRDDQDLITAEIDNLIAFIDNKLSSLKTALDEFFTAEGISFTSDAWTEPSSYDRGNASSPIWRWKDKVTQDLNVRYSQNPERDPIEIALNYLASQGITKRIIDIYHQLGDRKQFLVLMPYYLDVDDVNTWEFDFSTFSYTLETIDNNSELHEYSKVSTPIRNLNELFYDNQQHLYVETITRRLEDLEAFNDPNNSIPMNRHLIVSDFDAIAAPNCFLLVKIDEWNEFFPIPSGIERTGLSYYYSSPKAEAPNVLLLVTPPVINDGSGWSATKLGKTLQEATDLMKLRMIDSRLVRSNWFMTLLNIPSLFFEAGYSNIFREGEYSSLFNFVEKLLSDDEFDDWYELIAMDELTEEQKRILGLRKFIAERNNTPEL